jgi:hypothetical protein
MSVKKWEIYISAPSAVHCIMLLLKPIPMCLFPFISDCIVDYDKTPITNAVDRVYRIVNSCDQCEYTNNVRNVVKIIEDSLDKYGYVF